MKENPKDITGPVLLEDAQKTLALVTSALSSIEQLCDYLFGAADHLRRNDEPISGDGLFVELRETLVRARLTASACEVLASGLISGLSEQQEGE